VKQIVQSFKTGKLETKEVPVPACLQNGVLVKTAYSVISIGTEKLMIDLAKKSLIGKAKARPDQVKQVLQKVKKEGLKSTYQKVLNTLDEPKPLGYSCSGVVMEVGINGGNFQVGDRVACAGAGYANHAEVNFIPKNLVARIPTGVDLKDAAYTTIGAIALQGVRQAEPNLGDTVFVLGLGLLGLITVQLLKANGCRVIGADINRSRVELAKKLGADFAWVADSEKHIENTKSTTEGHGVDAVIITASSDSNEPIELAAELARKKGIVVAVGLIPLNVPRNAFYLKELDLRLSMSYGPGRYDPFYEERGLDYPIAYVRWTEKRNMKAVLDLIKQKKLDLKSLTSHRYKFEQASEVYKKIFEEKEDYLGILYEYGKIKSLPTKISSSLHVKTTATDKICLGLIGSGNYAGSVLYPHLKNYPNIEIGGIATATGISADRAAKKFKAKIMTTDYKELLKDKAINAVFITTRHNLHSEQTVASLNSKKHVFVEKPIALSLSELDQIKKTYKNSDKILYVGYNRRFSPHAIKLKSFFSSRKNPLNILYRVNAGLIPKSHWVQDPSEGGGRIIGEVCHFVDFFIYLTGSLPKTVYATALDVRGEEQVLEDNISVVFQFNDGSVCTLIYTANGDSSLKKEYVEIFGEGKSAILNDFKDLILYEQNKKKQIKLPSQDKGQANEIKSFLSQIQGKADDAFNFDEIYTTSLATFKILDSLRQYKPVQI
jgi:predicted dehydrogenase